jgi:hypothetical protein
MCASLSTAKTTSVERPPGQGIVEILARWIAVYFIATDSSAACAKMASQSAMIAG